MLHVAEFENLLVQLLHANAQLLGFVVEFALHFIKIGVKRSNRLFQINDFLVLCKQVSFIISDVILENGLVRDFVLLVLVYRLQAFDELLLVVVEVFDQTLQSFNLLDKRLGLLSFLAKLLPADLKVGALFLALAFECGNLLLQVVDLNVLLVPFVLNLDGGSLSGMDLLVEGFNLETPFFYFFLQSLIINLNCF